MPLYSRNTPFERALARSTQVLAGVTGLLACIHAWGAEAGDLLTRLGALLAAGAAAVLAAGWSLHPGLVALTVALPCWAVHISHWRSARWARGDQPALVDNPTRLARTNAAGSWLAAGVLVWCTMATAAHLTERSWLDTAFSVAGITTLRALLEHKVLMRSLMGAKAQPNDLAWALGVLFAVSSMCAFITDPPGIVMPLAALATGLALSGLLSLLTGLPPLLVFSAEPPSPAAEPSPTPEAARPGDQGSHSRSAA